MIGGGIRSTILNTFVVYCVLESHYGVRWTCCIDDDILETHILVESSA